VIAKLTKEITFCENVIKAHKFTIEMQENEIKYMEKKNTRKLKRNGKSTESKDTRSSK